MKLHKVLTNECLLWILPVQGRIQDLSEGSARSFLEQNQKTHLRYKIFDLKDSKRVENDD